MMMNQPWKLFLLILGIFLAGTVTGYFVYPQLAAMHGRPRHASPEQWGPARLKRLSERLNLTSEQEEKLRPIMMRDMAELGRIRTGCMTETKKIFEQMEHDIAELLTQEQRGKFEQMNREMRENMQKFMKDRSGGQRDGPHKLRDHPGAGDEPAPPPPEKVPVAS